MWEFLYNYDTESKGLSSYDYSSIVLWQLSTTTADDDASVIFSNALFNLPSISDCYSTAFTGLTAPKSAILPGGRLHTTGIEVYKRVSEGLVMHSLMPEVYPEVTTEAFVDMYCDYFQTWTQFFESSSSGGGLLAQD